MQLDEAHRQVLILDPEWKMPSSSQEAQNVERLYKRASKAAGMGIQPEQVTLEDKCYTLFFKHKFNFSPEVIVSFDEGEQRTNPFLNRQQPSTSTGIGEPPF